MGGNISPLLSVDARDPGEDLDIPTFLRKADKKAVIIGREASAAATGTDAAFDDGMEGFIGRLNRRLDHEHASIETVASIRDMRRYGLPPAVAGQLESFVGKQCLEDWVVAAFLNKLSRLRCYESLLSPRVRLLIQNYASRFGVMCVQLEPCLQPIIARCA